MVGYETAEERSRTSLVEEGLGTLVSARPLVLRRQTRFEIDAESWRNRDYLKERKSLSYEEIGKRYGNNPFSKIAPVSLSKIYKDMYSGSCCAN